MNNATDSETRLVWVDRPWHSYTLCQLADVSGPWHDSGTWRIQYWANGGAYEDETYSTREEAKGACERHAGLAKGVEEGDN